MISRRTLLGASTGALGVAMLPGSFRSIPWHQLRRHLRGELVLPSDTAYAGAKQLELGQFDVINPQGIARCVSAADVSVAIRFAQDHQLPVAVRSGGHSYGGYSTSPGLVIDLARLNTVTVGPGTVTIGPGAMNVQILNALAPHGMMVSEGGCATVAAGGFLQGGGFGFLTRPLGMACDAVTSAEVVLADGRPVTASPRRHSDLFWAIRGGGGGNFGVVTSFSVIPHVGDRMAMSAMAFRYDRAPEVLDGFARWIVDAPREIGGGAYLVQPDTAPGSVPNTNVMVTSTGTAAVLTAEVSRLLAITGQPLGRQDQELTYRDLEMSLFGCAGLTESQCQRKSPDGRLSRPAFGLERTRMSSRPLPVGGWTDIVSAFGAHRRAGQTRNLDLHMFGGKANDPHRTDTAYVHRDTLFSVNYRVTIADPSAATPESKAVARRWVDDGFAVVDPHSNGETYQNWMDPALNDWRRSYYAENYPRLSRIKTRYDPFRFFRFAQGVEPVI